MDRGIEWGRSEDRNESVRTVIMRGSAGHSLAWGAGQRCTLLRSVSLQPGSLQARR